jgi:hypothetical protein
LTISLGSCGYGLPDTVEIFVDTVPPGASCIISKNGPPVGQIDSTPGIVVVPNEEADYLVVCSRNGYHGASTVVHARAERRNLNEYFGGTPNRSSGGSSITFNLTPR